MHVIAGKAVGLLLAAERGLPRATSAARSRTRPCWPRRLAERGARIVSGGTDNHLALVDVTPLGVTGKEAEHLLDESRDHRQQERDPVRPAAAQHRVRDPRRDAATTTRGFGPDEMRAIARLITDAIARRDARPRRRWRRGRRDRGRFPCPACAEDAAAWRLRPASAGSVVPPVIGAFVVAAVVALLATPLVRRFVARELLDHPDARVNSVAVPRGGGVAVAIAFLVVAAASVCSATHRACPGSGRSRREAPGAVRRRGPGSGHRRARRPLRPAGAGSSSASSASPRVAVAPGITVADIGDPFGPAASVPGRGRDRVHRRLDRRDDQQPQLHRRARRAVDRDRPHRRGRRSACSASRPGPPAARRRAVLRARRRPARVPALELPPRLDLPGHGGRHVPGLHARGPVDPRHRQGRRGPAGPRRADHRHVLDHRPAARLAAVAVQPGPRPHPPSAARPGTFARPRPSCSSTGCARPWA